MRLSIVILVIVAIFGVFAITSRDHSSDEKEQPVNSVQINRNSSVDDIVFEEGKANVYVFWGDGCPHCEEELKFFEQMDAEHLENYNLYAFEVWKNEDNAELMNQFAEAVGETVSGVPFTIIGEQSFSGFGGDMGEDLQKAIMAERHSDFDAYKKVTERSS